MPDFRPPRHRLSGLEPEALMAQGLNAEESPIAVSGIEIETVLGRGGMGAVYLGRQLSLDREVAVKVLASELADDPQFLERLEREARVMARLRHPNIVAVYDFQRTDSDAAIIMEFVAGGSLREKLQQHPDGLPVAEVLRMLRQVAAALETAHANGVVHRDMKPENVLLDAEGTARVTDFGLALPLHEAGSRLTRTGTAVGTFDYMAPEQMRGADADERLDVFALGVLAYELLTGRTPRGSFDPPQLVRRDVPAWLGSAVMRALRPEPRERYASVVEFAKALEEPSQRRLWPWAAIAGLVFVSVLLTLREPAKPEVSEWRDAAAGTKIWEDVLRGDWRNDNGVLTSGSDICLVKLEDELPESYDVRMRVTRLEGQYSLALFFRGAGRMATVELDAWREGLAGVQMINGQDLTSGYGFRFPLVNGEPHELLVEVRPDQVRVTVDGQFRKAFVTKDLPLAISPAWELGPSSRPMALGIGSYQSPSRFENVEWRTVGGEGE